MCLALGSKLSFAVFCRPGSLVASCQHHLWTNLNFSKSSNLDRHFLCLHNKPQRMTISHHWLAPSRLGMTTCPKLRLSHSWAPLLPSQLRTLCWEPWGADQAGLPVGRSQKERISLAGLLPSHTTQSQFLVPMPSFSLPPWGSASSEVSCLKFI